jgi:hypothetical protein
MSATTEHELRRRCRTWLAQEEKAHRLFAIKMHGSRYMPIGLPDYFILKNPGRLILIELKREGASPRPSQVHMHFKLHALGFPVYVVDNFETFKDTVQRA